jgi:hypothetical protein
VALARRFGGSVSAAGWRQIARTLAPELAALLALILVLGGGGRGGFAQTPGQEAAWRALGPAEEPVERILTPTSGALLVQTTGDERRLYRSDDGGLTWRAIERPTDTTVVAISPTSHDLLYAAGSGGVFRSEDGGGDWQQVSDRGGTWIALEISPADAGILYGVAVVSPPADYGTNRDLEFRASRDAGATWETVRTQHERILSGTQPCGYAVPLLRPDNLSTQRVLTIEGCTGRGDDPMAGMSPDEGRTVALFPDLKSPTWGANAAVGGTGVKPERWYISLFSHGIAYGNRRQSRIMRTDDGGASWATVFEADEWPSTVPRKPIDFSRTLTYDPQRPDDVYTAFQHFEPDPASSSAPSREAGGIVRVSYDAGATWSDLGGGDLPSVTGLAVGVDGRYLFAGTSKGLYRLALSP